MLSFLPITFTLLPGLRRSVLAAYSTKAKSKRKVGPDTPSTQATLDPANDRVWLSEVRDKIVEILEQEGPVSRRKMYDERLSKIFPMSPFAPNPPPRPLWMRAQYTPEEERVYLTMSKFKRRLIRSLTQKGVVTVMTVAKVRKLIAEIDANETRPEILERKAKMERAVASETDTTFVWLLERWVTHLKQQYVEKALEQARITNRPVASRFKRA